ncbi:hypothetical protein ABK040_008694 [Willaertia magna]
MCEQAKDLRILEIISTSANLELADIKSIVKSCNNLEILRLVGCHINSEACKALFNEAKCERLHTLDLSHNNITKDDIRFTSDNLMSLEYLFLLGNEKDFDDEDFKSKVLEQLPNLKVIRARENDYSSLSDNNVFTHTLFNAIYNLLNTFEKSDSDMLKLANLLRNDSVLPFEVKEVSSLILESAINGCAEAQYFAGMLFQKDYYLGDELIGNPFKSKFFKPSFSTALSYFQMAADNDHPGAMYKIGQFHEYGLSSNLEKSDEKAFEWYLKSAEKNYPEGLLRIGEFYMLGIGCTQDEKKGIEYIIEAAEFECQKAQSLLANFYENGKVGEDGELLIERNLDLAHKWYSRYLDRKPDHKIFFRLGCLHLYEYEWENRDLELAINLFEQSAKLGNGSACFVLGEFYLSVVKNYEMSYFWFREGARLGHPEALKALNMFDTYDSRDTNSNK